MERLTKREDGTIIFNIENVKACNEVTELAGEILMNCDSKEVAVSQALRRVYLNRLADYEDLGFTPDELKTFIPKIT